MFRMTENVENRCFVKYSSTNQIDNGISCKKARYHSEEIQSENAGVETITAMTISAPSAARYHLLIESFIFAYLLFVVEEGRFLSSSLFSITFLSENPVKSV